MHHKAQVNSFRELVWVEGQNLAGWGCSECAWVFHPVEWPANRTLDEVTRHFQMQLDEGFAAHDCAAHPRGKGASP